jgi:hypothetical protein
VDRFVENDFVNGSLISRASQIVRADRHEMLLVSHSPVGNCNIETDRDEDARETKQPRRAGLLTVNGSVHSLLVANHSPETKTVHQHAPRG